MSPPLLSVVIPTYNRRPVLQRVLAAYERQEPADLAFEVVVVDDGSSDGSDETLATWRPQRYAYRFARQANHGPAAARNHALALAQGQLVLFTGDDVEPASDLLLEHWRAHQERPSPGTAILGLTRWSDAEPTTATMRHVDGPGAQQFSYHVFRDGAEYDFRHFYTSNVSLARGFLDREPSYFSTDFPAAAFEDAELAYRLARHGLRIFYRASAVAYHHHPYTVRSFFRRQVRCGEMALVLYDKFPQLKKWLALEELERERLVRLANDDEPVLRRLQASLAHWEDRVLDLAGYFDGVELPSLDRLLLPLFQYGYLKGLARAAHPELAAQRLCASLYRRLLPPAVRRFLSEMAALALPWPQADARAIAELR